MNSTIAAANAGATNEITTTVTVVGMTCNHCVMSVREELSELAGVTDVQVDLASGRVDIQSNQPLADADIAAAVAEAGYQVS